MSLADFRVDLEMCCRCSACKFIPLEKVKGKNSYVCPSIARYNFHTYSAAGRLAVAAALLDKRVEYSDKLLEVVYNCQMCGACDISCKYAMDMEVLAPLNELRISCVENGRTLSALDKVIENLRKSGNMVSAANLDRSKWLEGRKVRVFTDKKVEVLYYAGCRTSLNKNMWGVAAAAVDLMQKTGKEVGVMGEQERCCGGRAYQMGYKDDFIKQAAYNVAQFKKTGATTLVTGCAECYHTFKVLYRKFGFDLNIEVLHTTEYFSRLIQQGKLKLTQPVNLEVTYHDPCYLGRLGESYIPWQGKQVPGNIRIFEPSREFMRGTYGIYEPPRNLLNNIPGLKLLEMDRIKEYAWCCGAGGGVREQNQDFNSWTAAQRMEEAVATGASAVITACPGCQQSFKDALKGNKNGFKVYDIVEILEKAA